MHALKLSISDSLSLTIVCDFFLLDPVDGVIMSALIY